MSIIEKCNITNYQNPIIEYQGNFQTNNPIDTHPKLRSDTAKVRKSIRKKPLNSKGQNNRGVCRLVS